MTQSQLIKAAVYSLAILWIFTGLTSAFFAPNIGFTILAKAGIKDLPAQICVYGGALLDIAIGIWLLTNRQRKLCCLLQAATILSYSVLLTIIDSSFWLHPFGPLTKNLPILVLIGFVYMHSNEIKG